MSYLTRLCWGSLLFISSACVYNNVETLYPCQIGTTVSYSQEVFPIIQNNCLSCHDQTCAAGGVILEDYTNTRKVVDDGRLKGVINHEAGFPAMPEDEPQLPECELNRINAWINNGAPDN